MIYILFFSLSSIPISETGHLQSTSAIARNVTMDRIQRIGIKRHHRKQFQGDEIRLQGHSSRRKTMMDSMLALIPKEHSSQSNELQPLLYLVSHNTYIYDSLCVLI